MAAVYEAENVDIGKRVADQGPRAELTTAPRSWSSASCARPAPPRRSAARTSATSTTRASSTTERPFLVLELLEGESLYERMTKIRGSSTPRPRSLASSPRPARPDEGPRSVDRPPRSQAREHLPDQGRRGPAPRQDPRFRAGEVLRTLDQRLRSSRCGFDPRGRRLRDARVHEPGAGPRAGRGRSSRRSLGARAASSTSASPGAPSGRRSRAWR